MNTVRATDTRPLRQWLRGANGPHLLICCVEHPCPESWRRAVVAPGSAHAVVQLSSCVAEETSAVLLELVAGGASGITVILEGCANPIEADSVTARANAFLSALPRPETIDDATVMPRKRKVGRSWPLLSANAVKLSRRVLLGRPDGPDLAEPSKHPTERLLAVLRELTGGTGPWTELDAIPTGVPTFTATGCAGSGVCARTCPVGALTLTKDVLAEANESWEAITQFQLTFNPAKCTDCGLCLPVCPESALQRSGEYLWSALLAEEEVSLRIGLTRQCARCGAAHGRLGDLCAVCTYRTANPFGSTMPPGSASAQPKIS